MKILSVVIVFFFLAGSAFTTNVQADLARANTAYAAGSFAEAQELYQAIIDAGYASPGLYYNLGNTCFKQHEYAQSILWYERAKRLDPGNDDIDFNLNVANTKISDKIEPLPELFYKRWYTELVRLISVDAWAVISVWSFIAAIAGFVLYIAARVLFLRKIGFWTAWVLFFLSLFTILFAWSGYRSEKSTAEAIVFAPTITVKSSPDEKSTDLFVLHEGTKVSLLDNISGWYEIRIANGSMGWLPESALEKI